MVSYRSAGFFESLFAPRSKVDNGSLIITKDAGKTFQVKKLPFKMREGDAIRFHPKRADYILILEVMTVKLSFGHGMIKEVCMMFLSYSKEDLIGKLLKIFLYSFFP